jgi:hypothetical protein
MSQFAFNPYKSDQKPAESIKEDRFFEWTKNNFYRTSYGTMTSNVKFSKNRTKLSRKKKRLWAMRGLFPGCGHNQGSAKATQN